MSQRLRVTHYLNQFFGGLGGEDKAFEGPKLKEGLIGPGRAVQQALGNRGEVVATIICGDNYFAERTKEASEEVIRLLTPCKPDVLIAGPAFNAGRYGIACGEVCKAVQDKLGIPAVTGMYDENRGVDLYKKDVYIVKTADSARDTAEVASRMITLALKLVAREKIDRPSIQGYFPRGFITNEISDQNAAQRAISMLLAKIKGQPFEPELELPKFDKVRPAPVIRDIPSAKIALVTDGGLVPKGNPDNMASHRSTRFAAYNVKGLNSLNPEDFEANHIGYDTVFVNQNPNRLVPLDVMRDLEREGVIGNLHDKVYSTAGVSTTLDNAANIGLGIAEELRDEGMDGVILTST